MDMKLLNDGVDDDEEKKDNVASETEVNDMSSEEEWKEQVDRQWKKEEADAADDVEAVTNVRWDFDVKRLKPQDLFQHEDGSPPDQLKFRTGFSNLFNDPVKGFLAFMPLDFWRSVLHRTNNKAIKLRDNHGKGHVGGRPFLHEFRLDELMKFLGLLVMMSVVRAGEYRLYWETPEISAFLLPGVTTTISIISHLSL